MATVLTNAQVEQLSRVTAMPTPLTALHDPPALTGIISQYVELVLCLYPGNALAMVMMQHELQDVFHRDDRLEIRGVAHDNDPNMPLLPHITALATAAAEHKHVLVIDHGFEFHMNRTGLIQHLQLIHDYFGDRWHVIVLDTIQGGTAIADATNWDIQLMRHTSTYPPHAYIVHRDYLAPLIQNWNQKLCNSPTESSWTTEDVWLGFQVPVGTLRSQRAEPDLKELVGPSWHVQDVGFLLTVKETPPEVRQRVLHQLYLQSHKGHRLKIAVVHQDGQPVVHRHRRSYSATFYAGVRYFTQMSPAEAFLAPCEDRIEVLDLDACYHAGQIEELCTSLQTGQKMQPDPSWWQTWT